MKTYLLLRSSSFLEVYFLTVVTIPWLRNYALLKAETLSLLRLHQFPRDT